MTLHVLKESKLSSSICRLSPPSSPSRKASGSRPVFKSKLLAALDAEMAVLSTANPPKQNANTAVATPNTTTKTLSINKPIHPFFTPNSSALAESTVSKVVSKTKFHVDPTSTTNSKLARKTRNVATKSPEIENARIQLPLYSYKDYPPVPTVIYTRHEEEANELVQTLRGPLGFDLEWRIFIQQKRSPIERRTALVQLSDERMILLVQVSAMKKFPQKVKEVIQSRSIVKTGANIQNDGEKLFRDFGILPGNLVELGAFAARADPAFKLVYRRSIVSLARMVEMYMHKALDKGKVRTGNWENVPLTQEQITYAANDAHCALLVYNRLCTVAAKTGRTLSPAEYTSHLADVHAQKKAIASSASDTASVASTSTLASVPTSSATMRTTMTEVCSTRERIQAWTRPLGYVTSVNEQPRPQHLRAYNLWHNRNMPLQQICATLRSKENPLAESTVMLVCFLIHLQLDGNFTLLDLLFAHSWPFHCTDIDC
ncbi:hypothetical protein AcW1_002508 [Taiwanofungus camphoratus]|nr:hypothetical protein AcV5_009835 [Antrodia cinnamomea]KAI0926524.1 hypothetical protein AcV7_005433 [Antrodia cinnamomea]KAI0943311.1 hypothetical protein AcW1_002508 [Antrodia cinnamomea]